MQVGDTSAWERSFTEEDVRLFAHLSGDQGEHHVTRDSQGRLMVHGLLTATLPTKLGGDLNYIAGSMNFEFLRPVYVDDTLRCEAVIMRIEQVTGRMQMEINFTCRNQQGKEVLRGSTSGIVRMPANS
ncbi:MAG: MaoC family dehydratase N-terminal domain-containing protein [Ktedonobacteraceae bacterium]|nr:MaoC family dehydratase N-terminal domain-containing protein [Ktedonobacteraceae bacterium]